MWHSVGRIWDTESPERGEVSKNTSFCPYQSVQTQKYFRPKATRQRSRRMSNPQAMVFSRFLVSKDSVAVMSGWPCEAKLVFHMIPIARRGKICLPVGNGFLRNVAFCTARIFPYNLMQGRSLVSRSCGCELELQQDTPLWLRLRPVQEWSNTNSAMPALLLLLTYMGCGHLLHLQADITRKESLARASGSRASPHTVVTGLWRCYFSYIILVFGIDVLFFKSAFTTMEIWLLPIRVFAEWCQSMFLQLAEHEAPNSSKYGPGPKIMTVN